MTTDSITTDPITEDLEGRVGELLDRYDIEALVHRLGACLDDGRFEDLRLLLTADATASTPGGSAEGIDALVAQAARNHSSDERVQHAITDVLVDLDRDPDRSDGDAAVVRANLVVTFGPNDGGEVDRRMGGVYRFGARRTADGWRLTSIATAPVWREGELRPVPAPEPG